MEDDAEDQYAESIGNFTTELSEWFPRDILRRTNWLYRIDALRNHDIREMNLIWELADLCQFYAQAFLLWTQAIKNLIQTTTQAMLVTSFQKLYDITFIMTEMFLSEGYCFFLDYMEIAYYPASNRIRGINCGHRFKE